MLSKCNFLFSIMLNLILPKTFRQYYDISMKKILIIIFVILLGFTGISLYISKYWLAVSHYSISSAKITEPFRIVQISDLHNSVFGEHNINLVNKIKNEEPDIILVTGDLINYTDENLSIALELIEQLSEITDVYVSYGNHEAQYEDRYHTDLRKLYEDKGAVVLEYDMKDLVINNNPVRLGGIYGYCLPGKYLATKEASPEECDYLFKFQDTDHFKILMCHMPVCWIINGSLEYWDIDSVFAGHSHGGQIQIPFIGGLYAPDQGFFCGKEQGLYYSEDHSKAMVLTRGLGNTDKIPRFNNIPEVLVCDILPE